MTNDNPSLLQTINNELNPETNHLSEMTIANILTTLNQQDETVPAAIRAVLHQISQAVELMEQQLRKGGRVFYIGAGTSGRLGVLDSAECPPTFGTSPKLVQAVIAGGHQAMLSAVENVEDCKISAANELEARALNKTDVVIGIAASGRTPFVIGGLQYARKIGAKTIALSTRGRGEISSFADVSISPDVGPEALSGSTRMKSGTAQKMILGMMSTALMIRLGKVHGNRMIDVKASNEKLRVRATQMVCDICETDANTAQSLLNKVDYNVRAAVLMQSLDITAQHALDIANRPFETLKYQLDTASSQEKSGSSSAQK